MRAGRSRSLWVLFAITLPLVGCAPPEEEIDAAQVAIEEAEVAQAPTYASDAWREAQEAHEAATAEVEAQQARTFVTRSYSDAREMLAEAEEKAHAATSAAAEEKARLRDEARSALESARQGLSDARGLLGELAGCPRQPKGFSNDLELLGGQADALDLEYQSAQRALDDGDLYLASDLARAVGEKIDTLSAELLAAKERIGC